MATTIKLKSGSGAPLAGDLVAAEPAFDLTNKRLYTEDSGGTVIEVGTNPTSLTTGTFTSTGIDDNATSTAITIDSSEKVGIGTTSPANLLQVKGSSNGDGITIQRNSTTNGDYGQLSFVNSTTDSFTAPIWIRGYRGSAVNLDYMTFGSGGTERMRIAASGNVGIGTDIPAYKVDIYGDSSSHVDVLHLLNENLTSGNSVGVMFENYSNAGLNQGRIKYLNAGSNNSNSFVFEQEINGVNGLQETMRIDSSGNLLVGTTSVDPVSGNVTGSSIKAQGNLQCSRENGAVISGNRKGSDGVIFEARKDGTTVGSIGVGTSDLLIGKADTQDCFLRFGTGGSAITLCDSSGLNSNDGLVDLGQSNYRFKDLYLSNNISLSNASTSSFLQVSTNILQFGTSSSDPVAFYSNNTERMRIDSSGNVGIGTTSPSSYGYFAVDRGAPASADRTIASFMAQSTRRMGLVWDDSQSTLGLANLTSHDLCFHIGGIGGANEKMRIDTSGNVLVGGLVAGTPTNGIVLYKDNNRGILKAATTLSGADAVASFYNPNGKVGQIVTNGSTTAYQTSSDQRLKENIVDAPSASDDIDAIQVRSFDWKIDGAHQKYGMIAQELQSISPEAVSAQSDPEEMLGVDYSKLVPMMIKEIQDLRARVAQLEGE